MCHCLLAFIGSVKVNMKFKLTLFTFSTYFSGLFVHSLSVHAMEKKNICNLCSGPLVSINKIQRVYDGCFSIYSAINLDFC